MTLNYKILPPQYGRERNTPYSGAPAKLCSGELPVAQSEVLLRTAEGQETPKEELPRASQGEREG